MRSSKLRQRNIQNKWMGEKMHCSVLEVTRRPAFRLLDWPVSGMETTCTQITMAIPPWPNHSWAKFSILRPQIKKSPGDFFVRKDPKFLNTSFYINSWHASDIHLMQIFILQGLVSFAVCGQLCLVRPGRLCATKSASVFLMPGQLCATKSAFVFLRPNQLRNTKSAFFWRPGQLCLS